MESFAYVQQFFDGEVEDEEGEEAFRARDEVVEVSDVAEQLGSPHDPTVEDAAGRGKLHHQSWRREKKR